MAIGIIGRKRGMTRIFTEEGQSIPVTVIVSVHQGSCMDMTWILLLGDIGQRP